MGHEKNGFKGEGGGGQEKHIGCKGGITKKIPSSLAMRASVVLQKPTRMPKTSVSDVQKVSIFPGMHAPGAPT